MATAAFIAGNSVPKNAIAGEEVVVYTSVDQVFSQQVLKQFEEETSVKVKALYDVEASKTTGLVNRLIAEKNNPQADVFWNGEVARTLVLKEKGVLTPYAPSTAEILPAQFRDPEGYWSGFAARSRVLIYNTDMLSKEDLPKSILELTEPKWKGKVAIAYPLFGTTAAHVAALYSGMGKDKAEEYLSKLQKNDVMVVDGNSVVRDLVVEGRVPIGLTDTDDAASAIKAGKPVKMLFPDKEGMGTLMIPNTVAMIKGGPNPAAAKRFMDWLITNEVEKRLIEIGAAQVPVLPSGSGSVKLSDLVPEPDVKAMQVRYEDIALHLDEATRYCKELFVR